MNITQVNPYAMRDANHAAREAQAEAQEHYWEHFDRIMPDWEERLAENDFATGYDPERGY